MRRLISVLAAVVLGLIAVPAAPVRAEPDSAEKSLATSTSVRYVLEGYDGDTQRVVLIVFGRDLWKSRSTRHFRTLELRGPDPADTVVPTTAIIAPTRTTATLAVLELANPAVPGTYTLHVKSPRRRPTDPADEDEAFKVSITNHGQIGSPGTVNSPTNPLEWTALRNVPDSVANGLSATSGSGVTLSTGQIALNFTASGGDNGSATTVSRGDHLHDARYPTLAALGAAGTVNAGTNLIEWSQLKSIPTWLLGAGFAGSSGEFGTAATVARSDHLHDSRYPTLTLLSATGTINLSTNPIDWTALKNVPASVINGGATYTAGPGLLLTSGQFTPDFTTSGGESGTATTVSRGDHVHDGRYYTQAQLSTAGTINVGSNPVEWTKLKGVPTAFADGTDDSVSFAGSGSATTAARSDHNHDASYLGLSGGTLSGALSASTTGTALSGTSSSSTGTGVFGSATSTTGANFGVLGRSASTLGIGVFGDATATSGLNYGGYFQAAGNQGAGVYASGPRGIDARASGTGSSPCAVNAYTPSGTGNSFGVYSENASAGGIGVYARASSSTGSSYALYAEADSSSSAAVYAFQTQGGGNALIANLNSSSTPSSSANNIAVFQNNGSNRARIDRNGNMILNGTLTQNGSADFAERVKVTSSPRSMEPGDVIVIDPSAPRSFAVSSSSESALVAGVYSTKPAMLAGLSNADDDGWKKEEIPMAMVGIVPAKVCDEGGAIRIGDLLVTSSIRGHAKRAPANPAPGTIIGKALGAMDGRAGRVEVLLMAR